MQLQLPVRIEYLDALGQLQTTELFYGLHDAEVRQALLQSAGLQVLRWVRQTVPGDLFAGGSQYPSPYDHPGIFRHR